MNFSRPAWRAFLSPLSLAMATHTSASGIWYASPSLPHLHIFVIKFGNFRGMMTTDG